jgi:hypothetical protein
MPMIARSYSPSAVGQHEATMGWFDLFNEVGAVVMTISIVAIQPLVALIAGILILLIPRILNFVVAIYLILIGVLGLWPHLVHWSIKLPGLAARTSERHAMMETIPISDASNNEVTIQKSAPMGQWTE